LGEVKGFPQTRRRQAGRSLYQEIKSNRFCTASQRKNARSRIPETVSGAMYKIFWNCFFFDTNAKLDAGPPLRQVCMRFSVNLHMEPHDLV
jgi:hypothetical protein